MGMRCKVGDLCAVTHSRFSENIGRLVTITRPSFLAPWRDWECEADGSLLTGDYSEEEPLVPVLHPTVHFSDHELRPVRPSEGQDETLAWAALEKAEQP